jgi:hypothetical protein
MGFKSRKIVLMVALGFAVPLLKAQPDTGPNGMPFRPPPPPDTTRNRQQADQARDANIAPLKITYGKKFAEWTGPKLAELPHDTITVHNEHTKADETYSGVPLMELLARLGVPQKPKGKDFRLYLVAEGSDGYKVVYSIGEVSPDVHDGTVLLADSVDGKPIGDSGQLQLVCTGEKHPARWVHNVVSIRVMTAD